MRTLDVVVGLVLVPGRRLPRAGLLDEQVVVEEPDLLRAHQLAGDPGRGRLADELLELGDPLPVAEVLEEPPRVVRPRKATIARSLGSARLRSMPRSTSATCSGENAPRTHTAPSRWKSS